MLPGRKGGVETSVVVALPPARRWSRHWQTDHSKQGCRTGKGNMMLGSNSGRFVLFVCGLAVCGAAGVSSADGVGGGEVGRLHGDQRWGGKSASRGRLNLVPLRYCLRLRYQCMPVALVGGALEGLWTVCVCVHTFLEGRPSVHTTHDREDAVDRTGDTNNLHMYSVGPLHGFQHTIEKHSRVHACTRRWQADMHAFVNTLYTLACKHPTSFAGVFPFASQQILFALPSHDWRPPAKKKTNSLANPWKSLCDELHVSISPRTHGTFLLAQCTHTCTHTDIIR